MICAYCVISEARYLEADTDARVVRAVCVSHADKKRPLYRLPVKDDDVLERYQRETRGFWVAR